LKQAQQEGVPDKVPEIVGVKKLLEIDPPHPGTSQDPRGGVEPAKGDLHPVEGNILKQQVPGQGDGENEQEVPAAPELFQRRAQGLPGFFRHHFLEASKAFW
jgi:hypothetical protein